MLGAMFLFVSVDTQAKVLSETVPVLQIAWARLMGLGLGALGLLIVRGPGLLRTRHPVIQVTRGFLVVGSSVLFIIAITYVPLVDAVAVAFVAPLLVTIMGAIFLREPVGIHRWGAVVVGFVGAMIVIRPGLGVVHPAALLVLGAAGMFAVRQVISRMVSDSDSTLTTVAYTSLVGIVLISLPLPFIWETPQTTQEVVMLVAIGLIAACAEFLLIRALEVAQAVVVAPMQYTMLVWSAIYGVLVFSYFPDIWTWVGSLIIVASGLYTFHRERVRQQVG